MESAKISEDISLVYFDKLNMVVNYIENDIVKDESIPFNFCHVIKSDDPDGCVDWELIFDNDGSLNSDNRYVWFHKLVKSITDFAIENNCVDVVKRMVFLI